MAARFRPLTAATRCHCRCELRTAVAKSQVSPSAISVSGHWAPKRTCRAMSVFPLRADELRPGGNVSGAFLDLPEFNATSLQLLREMAPALTKASIFWHPASGRLQLDAVRNAATALGIHPEIVEVSAPTEFEQAFRAAVSAGCTGVRMLSSPLFRKRHSASPRCCCALRRRSTASSLSIRTGSR
jgi:hypothetical protein